MVVVMVMLLMVVAVVALGVAAGGSIVERRVLVCRRACRCSLSGVRVVERSRDA
jgi:hypothetical protein